SAIAQERSQQGSGRLGLLERRRMARTGHNLKVARARKSCGISVSVGAWNHAVLLACDHQRWHARAVQPLAQRAVVEIGWLEAHEGAEAQHLVAAHFLLDVATPVREETQRRRRLRVGEQQGPQRGQVDAAFGLRVHEHVADRRARYEQPASADQCKARDHLGMTHRELGRDPAADAMANEVEARESKGVEHSEIMEHDVVDPAADKLVRASAAGVGGRDHAGGLHQSPMERLEVTGDAVHVGKAVQIDERRTGTGLEHRNPAAAHIENIHFAVSGASCRSILGNSRPNSRVESARRRGATAVANRRMLLWASSSGMLPRWNWISKWPTLACSRISMMRV